MEQNDYRRGGKPNVFFGAQKRYFGATISVFVFNTAVLLGSSLACSGSLALDLAPATGSAQKLRRPCHLSGGRTLYRSLRSKN